MPLTVIPVVARHVLTCSHALATCPPHHTFLGDTWQVATLQARAGEYEGARNLLYQAVEKAPLAPELESKISFAEKACAAPHCSTLAHRHCAAARLLITPLLSTHTRRITAHSPATAPLKGHRSTPVTVGRPIEG